MLHLCVSVLLAAVLANAQKPSVLAPLHIHSFSVCNNQLLAAGAIDVPGADAPLGWGPQPVSISAPAGDRSCLILFLDLGPIHLNLLGLNVFVSEIVLNVTATSGPGEILGNLLCGAGSGGIASLPLDVLASALNTVFATADIALLALPGNGALSGFNGLDYGPFFEHLHSVASSAADADAANVVPTDPCPILSLSVQRLDLFLLGLEVQLEKPLTVTITANPVGGILGQLLCRLSSLDVSDVLPCSMLASAQSVASGTAAGGPLTTPIAPVFTSSCFTGTSCTLLSLLLGPLDLNLLGLEVMLNQVDLQLLAFPSGGVLGRLLCDPPTLAAAKHHTDSTTSSSSGTSATDTQSALQQLISSFDADSSSHAGQKAVSSGAPLVGSDPICPLIELTVGSLDLCLLGLELVAIPPAPGQPAIHLNVTAETGTHNFLGNLLCPPPGSCSA